MSIGAGVVLKRIKIGRRLVEASTPANKDEILFAVSYAVLLARNGFWSSPRGNVSQGGRFFMFTSDWEDQLGKMPNGYKYRTDVSIVELEITSGRANKLEDFGVIG